MSAKIRSHRVPGGPCAPACRSCSTLRSTPGQPERRNMDVQRPSACFTSSRHGEARYPLTTGLIFSALDALSTAPQDPDSSRLTRPSSSAAQIHGTEPTGGWRISCSGHIPGWVSETSTAECSMPQAAAALVSMMLSRQSLCKAAEAGSQLGLSISLGTAAVDRCWERQ